MWAGSGEARRRFIVCQPDEAGRDPLRRERALERIDKELAAIARKKTKDDRRDAEGVLLDHLSLGRYPRQGPPAAGRPGEDQRRGPP